MNISPAQQVSAIAALDEQLLRMWLHGRPVNTTAAYDKDARSFLAFTGLGVAASATLPLLQGWADSLVGAPATRARRIAAVKSLLAFALDAGVIKLNPGAALRVAKPAAVGGERILTEAEMARLIGAEPDPRRRALLRLLYVCGLRASEACALRWEHLTGNEKKGGQARILGKGRKLRTVGVPASLWRELAALTPSIRPEAPVIPGRDGKPTNRRAVHRSFKRGVRRSGVNPAASPHFARHSHASHALDNGASLASVRDGLGHSSSSTTSRYLHAKPGESSADFIKG